MEQLIRFFLLYFDCFKCHQNHALILFHHVICSESFWLWFQIDQAFPENTFPGFFPVLEGRVNLSFILPTCWFQSKQLENLNWHFLISERPLYTAKQALLPWAEIRKWMEGNGGSTSSWDLSRAGLWGWIIPSRLPPGAFRELRYDGPQDTIPSYCSGS